MTSNPCAPARPAGRPATASSTKKAPAQSSGAGVGRGRSSVQASSQLPGQAVVVGPKPVEVVADGGQGDLEGGDPTLAVAALAVGPPRRDRRTRRHCGDGGGVGGRPSGIGREGTGGGGTGRGWAGGAVPVGAGPVGAGPVQVSPSSGAPAAVATSPAGRLPPTSWAQRLSFWPAWRSRRTTSGSVRRARRRRASSTSSWSAKGWSRSVRDRSSPGVWGPRSMSTQSTAASGPSRPSASSSTWRYLSARLERLWSMRTRLMPRRLSRAFSTVLSSSCTTGWRFVLWLHASSRALSVSG